MEQVIDSIFKKSLANQAAAQGISESSAKSVAPFLHIIDSFQLPKFKFSQVENAFVS